MNLSTNESGEHCRAPNLRSTEAEGYEVSIFDDKDPQHAVSQVRMHNVCINDVRYDRCQRSNLSFIVQTRPSIKLRKILGVGGQCPGFSRHSNNYM